MYIITTNKRSYLAFSRAVYIVRHISRLSALYAYYFEFIKYVMTQSVCMDICTYLTIWMNFFFSKLAVLLNVCQGLLPSDHDSTCTYSSYAQSPYHILTPSNCHRDSL